MNTDKEQNALTVRGNSKIVLPTYVPLFTHFIAFEFGHNLT